MRYNKNLMKYIDNISDKYNQFSWESQEYEMGKICEAERMMNVEIENYIAEQLFGILVKVCFAGKDDGNGVIELMEYIRDYIFEESNPLNEEERSHNIKMHGEDYRNLVFYYLDTFYGKGRAEHMYTENLYLVK